MYTKTPQAPLQIQQSSSPTKSGTHVVFYIAALRQGGAERVLADLATQFYQSGYKVTLVCLHRVTEDDYQIDQGITRISLDLISPRLSLIDSVKSNINRLKHVRAVLRDCEADVVISFMTTSNILVLLATIGTRIPVVVSERIYPPASDLAFPWRILRVILYRRAAEVVVQANKSREWFKEKLITSRAIVIPNSVTWPPSDYHGSVMPVVCSQSKRKKILAVGRLVPQKGFDLLIESFSTLAAKHHDWDLYIVGSGDKQPLIEQIEVLDLNSRVVLVGQVGNMADWYEQADMFVLSSIYEGFPNSLAEAMAAGLAVVSFDCLTGPSELIVDEKNGLLIPPENTELLTEGMDRLMSGTQLRHSLGLEAKSILNRYSVKSIFSKWTELVEKQTNKA